jgi:peptidoglycan/xylan/chitin deacetylase (PgdA/CDA1 family)
MDVALVFDDGPVDGLTPTILRLFSREGVRASFGYVGRNIAAFPDLVVAAHQAGHEIVNHSYSHPHFASLDSESIRREVVDTQEAVGSLTGAAPKWFWVPFGEWNDHVASAVASTGVSHFPVPRFRFVSTEDWQPTTSAEAIYRRATVGILDHTIILFHEWRRETVGELPSILASLRDQGCRFVTLSELAVRQAA